MMNIEQWATSPTVSSFEYWEGNFSGNGARIVEITAPFQNWKPIFGNAYAELEQEIRAATQFLGVRQIRVFSLDQANEGQALVNVPVGDAYHARIGNDRFWHEVNDAVGDAFGPVIGRPIPSVMLRAWLYELLTCAIAFVLLACEDLLGQIKTVLSLWKNGIYLIGFDTRVEPPVAIVVSGEAY